MRSLVPLVVSTCLLLAGRPAHSAPPPLDLAPFASIEVAPFSLSSFGFSELDKGPGAVRDEDPQTAWEVPAEEGSTASMLFDWSTRGGIEAFPVTSVRIDIDPPDAPIRLFTGPDQGTLTEMAADAQGDATGVTLTFKEAPSLRVLQAIFPGGARVARVAVFGGPTTGTLGPVKGTCDEAGVHLTFDGDGLLAVEATRDLPSGGTAHFGQRSTSKATLTDASVRFDPRPMEYTYSVSGVGSSEAPVKVDVTCSGAALVRPPEGPVHGVIEGFYGRPWTWHEREKVVLAMGALGLDTYVYAPKQDPKHRDAWREPYSDEEMAHFKAVADAGRGVGVNVVWAVSPGKDIDPEDPADVQILLDKVGSMAEKAGIRDAALLMDDLSQAHTAALGQAHADLATALLDAMKARDSSSRLWFVPTVYAGLADGLSAADKEYLAALATLPLEVPLAWTGQGVFSKEITLDDAAAFGALAGKEPSAVFVWDNYPVNDVEVLRSLHTHPITGRETLFPESGGLLANPMRHALASLPAIASYAELSFDPVQYTTDRGQGAPLRTADLALLLADADSPPRALADLFAEMVHHDTLWPDELASPALTKALADHAAAKAPGKARRDAALALGTLLGRLAIADVDLRRDLADQALSDEIDAYARATQVTARAALFALSAERAADLGEAAAETSDRTSAACLWLTANQPSWRTVQDAIAPLIPEEDAADCPPEDPSVGPTSVLVELGQKATFPLPPAFSEADTTIALLGPEGAAASGDAQLDWTPSRLGRFRLVALRSGDAGVSASVIDVRVVEKLPVANTPSPAADPGCGCRTAPRDDAGAALGLLALAGLLFGRRANRIFRARRPPCTDRDRSPSPR